jgi:hypothetical protein
VIATGGALGDRGGEFVFSPRVAPPSPEAQAALAGQLVDEVGRRLDEPAPIRFAARLWRRIASSKSVSPPLRLEAKREHARAQLLLGRRRAALRELDATLDHDPEARLLRARALLRLDRRALAADELDESIHAYLKNGAPFGIDGEVTAQRPDPSTRTRQS